ncbi:hypothetical protein [Mesorhizobium sp. dw_380]|uniref:hypothetical protein n=1 Tax=Mesorhizobium sp. dw_380 TaxID=2812001 RepID=UPI001BDE7E24|nr:hypothetical protein [Mesorhizobium sp. dw_380]
MPRAVSKKPRPRKAKAKSRVRLSDEDVAEIRELILEWKGPLTWDNVVKKAELICGNKWTRQGLFNHIDIKSAFQKKKISKVRDHQEGDLATIHLSEKIERLEIELSQLRDVISRYDELFVRYQANAHRRGITPGELELPLSPIERKR